MKLQIDRNKYPLNVSEQNKLLDFIKEKIILNVDESKLINWNEFIHSDKYKADKRTNNITATQIVVRGANNLVIDEEKDYLVIHIDKYKLVFEFSKRLFDMCKMINYGNTFVKGYSIFSNTFQDISNNLYKYLEEILM